MLTTDGRGSRDDYEEYCHLRCGAVQSGIN
jgi:hypothetical protein